VPYQFVTKCVGCAKEFGILWVMDSNRIGHNSVARTTCPLCGKRFNQLAKDLLPIASPIKSLVVCRPVRSVEIDYDCPYCGNRGILISLLHTDLSWDELSKEEAVQTAACDSNLCSQRDYFRN
jgi:DNA-directed RNA polymerase subunit RPC12/RpoP